MDYASIHKLGKYNTSISKVGIDYRDTQCWHRLNVIPKDGMDNTSIPKEGMYHTSIPKVGMDNTSNYKVRRVPHLEN